MATWAAQIANTGVLRGIHPGDLANLGEEIVGWQIDTTNGYGFNYRGTSATFPEVVAPYIDVTQGYESAGAVTFPMSSPAPADWAGSFTVRFSDDQTNPTTMNAVGVSGEGAPLQEIYIQVCVKWSANFWDTIFLLNDGSPQGGIKVFDVITGWPKVLRGTSSQGIVVQTVAQTKVLSAYYYPRTYSMWDSGTKMQNSPAGTLCDYYAGASGCWYMPDDDWGVIHVRAKVLDRVDAHNVNFEFDISTKSRGGAMTLRNTWNPSTPGYIPKRLDIGEMWSGTVMFPYMSGKNELQLYATPSYVAYDNIIISTTPILTPDDPSFSYTTTPAVKRSRARKIP